MSCHENGVVAAEPVSRPLQTPPTIANASDEDNVIATPPPLAYDPPALPSRARLDTFDFEAQQRRSQRRAQRRPRVFPEALTLAYVRWRRDNPDVTEEESKDRRYHFQLVSELSKPELIYHARRTFSHDYARLFRDTWIYEYFDTGDTSLAGNVSEDDEQYIQDPSSNFAQPERSSNEENYSRRHRQQSTRSHSTPRRAMKWLDLAWLILVRAFFLLAGVMVLCLIIRRAKQCAREKELTGKYIHKYCKS